MADFLPMFDPLSGAEVVKALDGSFVPLHSIKFCAPISTDEIEWTILPVDNREVGVGTLTTAALDPKAR
jgi:hypothetical protein